VVAAVGVTVPRIAEIADAEFWAVVDDFRWGSGPRGTPQSPSRVCRRGRLGGSVGLRWGLVGKWQLSGPCPPGCEEVHEDEANPVRGTLA
jgi:hypothetical protein